MDSIEELQIKLTDFGFSTFFKPELGMNEVLGSPLYMPPEIIQKQQYDSKVDIWSAGVVAYVLLTGEPPFNAESIDELKLSIVNDDFGPEF